MRLFGLPPKPIKRQLEVNEVTTVGVLITFYYFPEFFLKFRIRK